MISSRFQQSIQSELARLDKRAEAETVKIAEHQLKLDGVNAERERLKNLLQP